MEGWDIFASRRRLRAELVERARADRIAATKSEALLWSALRRKQLRGVKFRRQHPLHQFILDFYSPSQKLVVEIDGSSHDGIHDYDAWRTRYLEALGLRVLRLSASLVETDLRSALLQIENRLALEPVIPSPRLRGGAGGGV